ncbi:unannotated protein [freshwater metagenome]|uniref:Unannotated protein n=1 Tax=freshwater metagenome TaxID=449393 RepID=A0A6J6KV68_9ZZZZ
MPAAFKSFLSSGGIAKSKCSSIAVTVCTSENPRSANHFNNSSTKISGTDAPLETPIVVTPVNHSSLTSSAKSTRYAALAPYSSETSTKRTEFEEFVEPTTKTKSACGAICLMAT